MDAILAEFIDEVIPLKNKIEQCYLFGSRARGDERPNSDYDLLFIVKENFSRLDKDFLYDKVMNVLLESGRLISLKIFPKREFERLCGLQTPFMMHVLEEGIKIG
jgi:predicted nucleotidyltransferase